MLKIIISIGILLCHFTLSAQDVYRSYGGIPVFQGSPLNLAPELGLGELKMKTQDFISQNLDQAFTQKYLPKDKNVEFNIQYTVEANGMVLPESIMVNTSVDFFNLKMKSVLVKLPRFIPAKSSVTKENYAYTLKFTPEFFVNQNNQLIPVYRQDLPNIVQYIDTHESELFEAATNLGYNTKGNDKIVNIVHFRTNENKDITDMRIFIEHEAFSEKIKRYILNIEENDNDLFKELRANNNYAVNVYLFLRSTQPYMNTNQVNAVYPGCEKKGSKKEKDDCFRTKITNYVHRNTSDYIFTIVPPGEYKIRVFFTIDAKGNVEDVKVRAPYPKLEEETNHIISLLPKMAKPGLVNGKPGSTTYFLPINLVVTKPPISND